MKHTAFTCLLAGFLATASRAAEAPNAQPEERPETRLPITELVLYSSGVGFFERTGEVQDRARVDLSFKIEDINDLLKSMVVQDFGGGQVSTVTYASRDPLAKTLKSFGVDLTDNPSQGQLLNQMRGEKVEVSWPNRVTGTILGVERKQQRVADDKILEVEFLNLLTDEGLLSIPLPQVQRIRLLNERLNAELRQALEVIATGHDTQKKTVTIAFDGQGKRKVGISYIAQTPVWKTSYRLVLQDKDKPYLQGWAMVENTSDEDWKDVRLSLVSGRPISFIMDLYQPLYTTRPVVRPELYLSLRPQVYGDAVEELRAAALADAAAPEAFYAQRGAAVAGAPASGPRTASKAEADKVTRFGAPASLALGVQNESLGRRLNEAQAAVAQAEGGHTGELFQYVVTTPVTLARQKSAMIPIVSHKIEGEKISIYNQNVDPKRPLNGFRLKNTTGLHFMQGPITVFDDGNYAGDARIEDVAPGQDRLISYALDLKTEVEPHTGSGRQDLVSVAIRKGTLIATRKASEEKTYNIRNRDQKPKKLLVEHPFRADWNLVEPKDPAERTRDVYRFQVQVEPDKTAKLVVREDKQLSEQVQLVNSDANFIGYYLRSQKVSAKVKDALRGVVTRRDRLNETAAERSRRELRVSEITQEQARIRENMAKLNPTSDLYTRYVQKLDQQESELETLRQQIESLKNTEAKLRKELDDYLAELDVE